MTFVEPFDPYLQWLGIPRHERPVDPYRLLGLNRFESDVSVIARAADERMTLVRSYQTGRRGLESQRIMNELAAAKVCLLNPLSKENLDRSLRQMAGTTVAEVTPAGAPQTMAPQPPPVKPPPVPPPLPAPKVRIALDVPDELPAGPPAKSSPWWVPVVSLVGLAILFLAATIAWGVLQDSLASRNLPSASNSQMPGEESDSAITKKAGPVAKPIVLFQEGSGEVNFSPAVAERSGSVELQTIDLDETLVNWSDADSAARWHFRLVTPGFFKAEVTYATSAEANGGQLELTVGDKSATCNLRSTGDPNRFVTDTCTIAIPTSGEHSLVARSAGPQSKWFVLKAIRFIPVSGITTPVIPPE